jgi:hypothetical protein
MLSRQESLKHRQQEGAKPTLVRVDGVEEIVLQQPSKELLCVVGGSLGGKTAPPGINIKRIPIRSAQSFESL